MNFVFISPNFPQNFWQFCDRLKRNGVTVLGIGDAPYDSLTGELRSALTEYYKVDSIENYDSVFRAVAFFAFKYGKIDWIESNNEHWLGTDAKLRRDFNVTTGVQPDELALWQSKSAMKPVYKEAGIPSARNHQVSDIAAGREFIYEIGGYPVFAKPNVGVGASATYKIDNEEELTAFYDAVRGKDYVMEEYIEGDIYTYDAICDQNGDPIFESTLRCVNVADSVNDDTEAIIFVMPHVPDQLRDYGRKALKGFKVKSRFVHFEFFRLTKARKGLAEVGDFVGLEVNMRPAGGFIPDMMNFSHSTDVYQIWADMVCFGHSMKDQAGPYRWCVFVGTKDRFRHTHTHDEILAKYGSRITMCQRMPDVFTAAMGNQMYMALLDTEDDVREYIRFILDEQAQPLMPSLYDGL
ncbi:MAG: carbamoylphosphate synthase large subunit [Mogibacterium sp.]|nr:carbamoylphosphate synthase large subunit [Mogibacterium sp.]